MTVLPLHGFLKKIIRVHCCTTNPGWLRSSGPIVLLLLLSLLPAVTEHTVT